MSAVSLERRPPRASAISRLCKLVTRRMTVDEIELEYVSRYGKISRKYMLFELSNLEAGGVIHRVKQGVYEP